MPSDPGIGPRYQDSTKYRRHAMPGMPSVSVQVPLYKRYERPLAHIELPDADTEGGPGLWATVARRRSRRRFTDQPISLQQLSQLLWAVAGVTAEQSDRVYRAAASAGALYPNESDVLVSQVIDCPSGIYHYEVREHRLALLAEGDYSLEIGEACMDQASCASAAVVLAFGAVAPRCGQKYGDRAYRYIYMDAGHLGAHVQLAAEALDLGSVNIGAFFDDEVNHLLGLDGVNETVVYLAAVGQPNIEDA